MKTTGAIQDKTEKHGVTRGRSWTRTTITINGEQYSTLKPVDQNPGAFVTVEYEDGKYGHNILDVKAADPTSKPQENFTTAPPAAKAAPSGVPIPVGSTQMQEVLTRLENIENYLAQFDKKYLELFQGVSERLEQEHATIQTIAGTTTRLSTDFADFMKEQAENEVS